jgi:Ca2+-binding RTX toxin-like protein
MAGVIPGLVQPIQGGSGDDVLFGSLGDDVILGLAGADEIDGSGGNDIVDGGEGNDDITTEDGNDSIVGNTGDDQIDSGAGLDTIFGGDGNDTAFGGDGNDTLYGDNGDNTDTLNAGNDYLDGQRGDDVILGETGTDTLIGGLGSDFISGGDGDDLLYSHTGRTGAVLERDEFYGGAGADQFNLLTNYGGGKAAAAIAPRLPSSIKDNSFAVIRDFSIADGDTLGLLDRPTRRNGYTITYGNFDKAGKADTFINKNNNLVAVVTNTTLTLADLVQATTPTLPAPVA